MSNPAQASSSTTNSTAQTKPVVPYPRISINKPEENASKGFPDNLISTTKYSLITFLPKNLYEQFRKATNIYFLAVVVITLIPQVSPLTPVTSILPLAFVLGVAAIKEAFEDFKRYQSDKKLNTQPFHILEGGKRVTKQSKDIKVGDFIYLEADAAVPADVVLLASGLEHGVCYVETAALDGETNLKLLKATKETLHLTEEDLSNFGGEIEVEPPNNKLSTFSGALHLPTGEKVSLNQDQLLLRGVKIRNTPWAIGIAVYCGKKTKLSLNQQQPPSKFTRLDKRLNHIVVGVFVFKFSLCIIAAGLAVWFKERHGSPLFYVDWNTDSGVVGVINFFSYFAIMSFLIPMSLMVTLEVVKVSQAKLMEWDEEMALDPSNVSETGMIAKNSNLNDELSLVKYVFSDKTGTLTENLMEFRKCSVNCRVYEDPSDSQLKDYLMAHPEDNEDTKLLREFLLTMAVCHSVVPKHDKEKGDIIYEAQSPDESALCKAASNNGYVFTNRTTKGVVVSIFGKEETYEVLCLLDFTSDRKRMTVAARCPDNKIKVFCKGADSIMLERLRKGDDIVVTKTKEDLKKFSEEGLRTLIMASKDMTEEEWNSWYSKYHEANTAIENRAEKVAAVSELLERDYKIVGSSAIEDKLQKGVPETIASLLQGGIKVWVITGDKQETAINIGYSCRLLEQHMNMTIISECDSSDTCGNKIREALAKNSELEMDGNLAMVIDGKSLNFALMDHSQDLLRLANMCKSVICCRVSPLQKALVVRLVKVSTGAVTLAIGDGGNDVSMIQEAHIGVGIFGREGSQAARASDYALQQFRHLKRLVFVHGRYSMLRNSSCIKYSYYKNMAMFLTQFWFSFYNGFSAQTLYDDWVVTLFNIIFTSLPPYFIAVFEKDITENIIMDYPRLYKPVQNGLYLLNYLDFLVYYSSSFYHSLVFFFSVYFATVDWVDYSNGQMGGLWVTGLITSTCAVTVILLKCALVTKLWNGFIHFGIWGSFIAYIIVIAILSALNSYVPMMVGIFNHMFMMPAFYFLWLLNIVVCLTPDLTCRYLRRMYFPHSWEIIQEKYKYDPTFTPGQDLEMHTMSVKSSRTLVQNVEP